MSRGKPKVLISDELSETAIKIFEDNGILVNFDPKIGKAPEKLKKIIGDYDGLAIRSNTRLTANIIAEAVLN